MVKLKKKTKKKIIEAGMVGSMVGMVATGIQGSKKPHIATSVAFLAFTALHYNHYRPIIKRKKNVRAVSSAS